MLGIIGKKIGMTRAFDAQGNSVPVTVIQTSPCTVTEQRSMDKNGYTALQLGFEKIAEKKLNKPEQGQYTKKSLSYFSQTKEFRVEASLLEKYPLGSEVLPTIFASGEPVHVTGISKGKGFAGVMKRYNFGGKEATHGTHESFRGGGSIGQCATPSRVMKNKKMAGHMGNARVTVRNLSVFKVDTERNLIMLAGAVPGHRNSIVTIQKVK